MPFDEAPYPSVEDEPIARMRTFSPFCSAAVMLGSVAGAAISVAGTSQGGLIGGAAGGALPRGAPASPASPASRGSPALGRLRLVCQNRPQSFAPFRRPCDEAPSGEHPR